MKDARIPGEKNQHLILCSDAIRTSWDITKSPSVFKQDTATGLTPRIDVTCLQTPDALAITVRDNGIGFYPKQQHRIFELFERLHSRARYPGSGIGLSICKRIAGLHHGSISATAEAGEYASSQVTLPLSQQSHIHTA